MKVLIVYAHHDPTSLTASLKNVTLEVLAAAGHTVVESDLYATGFHATAETYDFSVRSTGHFNYMNEQKNAAMHDMAFGPDIMSEIGKLQSADLVVFHFPMWWSSVPAILKGWFDRVLAMGVAWDGHGRVYQNGLLRGKQCLVVTTAGESVESYSAKGIHHADAEQMLYPVLRGTLAYCGFDVLKPYILYDVMSKSPEQMAQIIELYRTYVADAIANPSYYVRYSVSA